MSTRPRDAERHHRVCSTGELPPGSHAIFSAGGRSIGVFNVDGEFHALLNRCPHGGAPLCLGTVGGMSEATHPTADITWSREGEILRCPWHGWEFEIASGRTVTDPPLRVKTFRVFVENDEILVEV